MVAPLANLGSYKGESITNLWCFHLLLLCVLRCLLHQLCHTYSNMYFLTHKRRINHRAVRSTLNGIAGNATFMEHLVMLPIVAILLLGASMVGHGSVSMVYVYILGFDFLRCMGHSNIEIIPHRVFDHLPLLRYLLYTHTYHSIHHSAKDCNFCLFMPFYDLLGNTLNRKSWGLHKQIRLNAGKNMKVPEFVFLGHAVDITSSIHASWVFRSFASMSYSTRWFLLPFWPIAFLLIFPLWAWGKPIVTSFYNLRGKLQQTWIIPRYGFQYFLPFAKKGINKKIEYAILKADKMGVKVISLAALNKNEALNGGGTLFVNKHPNLRVRVVHGNTLTAAVILDKIPKDVKEVFLTGATSKLGRAIALYLCRKQVRVLMLTLSTQRFKTIQKEGPVNFQKYMVQVTKYHTAKNCKTWITPREQSWAPPGTHFHQFVVPPILQFRRDCTYGELAAMKLPSDVQGIGSCEYTMERGVVQLHACHAGGVVHSLEDWLVPLTLIVSTLSGKLL
ncbi:hypothetical protein RND81_08G181700 [Saponaria officinalis]|uniref:Uncharacterized protein n=1 Tax=Saponaria officinalis TaxID=3572 RepID=A0AAW1JBY2_SAPOF